MADNIKIGLLALIAVLLIIRGSDHSSKEPVENVPAPGTNSNVQINDMGGLTVNPNPNPQPVPTAAPTTSMSFDNTDVNLGNVKPGAGATHTYTVTNTGTLPLIFNKVHGDPGITISSSPSAPIAPGATGEITIQVNDDIGVGNVQKTIHVGANTEPSHMHLTVSANVEK